ncbi:MAG TPA: hypothetical protein VH591_21380 [Ktedonobacterales bacterium]|jgi:hypothetical protein
MDTVVEPTTEQTDTSDLGAREALQLWLDRTFPGELRHNMKGIGYYAAINPDWDRHASARLHYYDGYSKAIVEAKLRIAGDLLDAKRIRYTWAENSYGYKYLVVQRYHDEEPEPAARPKRQRRKAESAPEMPALLDGPTSDDTTVSAQS